MIRNLPPDTSTLFIFAGGPGGEHEVSLVSGNNLLEAGKKVFPHTRLILLEKNGTWTEGGMEIPFSRLVRFVRESNGLVFPIVHGSY